MVLGGREMKKYLAEIIVGSVALLAFIGITIFVFAIGSLQFDTDVFNTVAQLRYGGFIDFFKVITFFGGVIFNIGFVVVSISFLFNRNRSTYKVYFKNDKFNNLVNLFLPWLIFAFTILIEFIIFFSLKNIFARPRPVEWFLVNQGGYSFPSGHTTTATTLYGTLVMLINNSTDKKWVKILTWTLMPIIVVLIGISRIFLGVHYTTDVLAGLMLGIVMLCIASVVIRTLNPKICYKNIADKGNIAGKDEKIAQGE